MSSRTEWFRAAKWGLFFHYLAEPASSTNISGMTADQWNDRVDSFRVDDFVRQVAAIAPGYIMFTIGQNSGHFCSPNSEYDRLVGITPSKLSRRDLIAEIADALKPHGIRTIAYLPAGAPEYDKVAVERLGWDKGNNRNAEFQERWEAIIRCWGERWGDKIAGWWLDGCYYADAMYRHDEAPNFASFASALRAGNPDRIVSFNPGWIKYHVESMTEFEDYTAGEAAHTLPVLEAWTDPAQFHVLSYIGSYWGRGEPRMSSDLVAAYTADVVSKGGVVTWDIPVSPEGAIPKAFFQPLEEVGAATAQITNMDNDR